MVQWSPYEQTDTSENITFPTTSLADGKNLPDLHFTKNWNSDFISKFEKMHRFFFCESLFGEIMKNIMEVFNQ